jgi:hypothetical protein
MLERIGLKTSRRSAVDKPHGQTRCLDVILVPVDGKARSPGSPLWPLGFSRIPGRHPASSGNRSAIRAVPLSKGDQTAMSKLAMIGGLLARPMVANHIHVYRLLVGMDRSRDRSRLIRSIRLVR